jgi:hypothetical protein
VNVPVPEGATLVKAAAGAVPSQIAIFDPIEPGLKMIELTSKVSEGSEHMLEPIVEVAILLK